MEGGNTRRETREGAASRGEQAERVAEKGREGRESQRTGDGGAALQSRGLQAQKQARLAFSAGVRRQQPLRRQMAGPGKSRGGRPISRCKRHFTVLERSQDSNRPPLPVGLTCLACADSLAASRSVILVHRLRTHCPPTPHPQRYVFPAGEMGSTGTVRPCAQGAETS